MLSSSSWPPSGPLTSNTYLSDFSATASPSPRGEHPPAPLTLTWPSTSLNLITTLRKDPTSEHLQSWWKTSCGWTICFCFFLFWLQLSYFFWGGGEGRCWGPALLLVTLMPLLVCVFVCVASVHAHVNVQCVCVCVFVCVFLQGAYSTSLLANCHLRFRFMECNSMRQLTDFKPLKFDPQLLTPSRSFSPQDLTHTCMLQTNRFTTHVPETVTQSKNATGLQCLHEPVKTHKMHSNKRPACDFSSDTSTEQTPFETGPFFF